MELKYCCKCNATTEHKSVDIEGHLFMLCLICMGLRKPNKASPDMRENCPIVKPPLGIQRDEPSPDAQHADPGQEGDNG